MDCSPPGSSVHGIFQARVLEWGAISFSRGSSWPRNWTWVSCIADRRFTLWATREGSQLLGQGTNKRLPSSKAEEGSWLYCFSSLGAPGLPLECEREQQLRNWGLYECIMCILFYNYAYISTYMWNLAKRCRWTHLERRNRDTDVESAISGTME